MVSSMNANVKVAHDDHVPAFQEKNVQAALTPKFQSSLKGIIEVMSIINIYNLFLSFNRPTLINPSRHLRKLVSKKICYAEVIHLGNADYFIFN